MKDEDYKLTTSAIKDKCSSAEDTNLERCASKFVHRLSSRNAIKSVQVVRKINFVDKYMRVHASALPSYFEA